METIANSLADALEPRETDAELDARIDKIMAQEWERLGRDTPGFLRDLRRGDDVAEILREIVKAWALSGAELPPEVAAVCGVGTKGVQQWDETKSRS